MSQYHLHVLLHCMHLFYLACFVLGELRMTLDRLHVLLRYMRSFLLGLFCVGRAAYDTWPLACVVTLYAFVSLGLFCVGERHMILCHLDLSLRCMRLFRLACMLGGAI